MITRVKSCIGFLVGKFHLCLCKCHVEENNPVGL